MARRAEIHQRTRGAPLRSREKRAPRLYDTTRWRTLSHLFLQANPLCVACSSQGIVRAANEVDHITPHRGDQLLFWDSTNWQSLCAPCHGLKTASETRAMGGQVSRKVDGTLADEVVVVCGPVGSGRREYAEAYVRASGIEKAIIVDELDIASRLYVDKPGQEDTGATRYTVEKDALAVARSHVQKKLHRLTAGEDERPGLLVLIVEAPGATERRSIAGQVKAARVVVLEVDTGDCVKRGGQGVESRADRWWRMYSTRREDEVRRG